MDAKEVYDYSKEHGERAAREKFGLTREAYRALTKELRPKAKLSQSELQKTLDAYRAAKTATDAAHTLGIYRSTLGARLSMCVSDGLITEQELQGIKATKEEESLDVAQETISRLRNELKTIRKSEINAEEVRRVIYKLQDVDPTPPKWVINPKMPTKKSPGIPSLFLSDLHFGEVVDPAQVNGVNFYNIKEAEARIKLLITSAINLLKNHVVSPEYPGIVFPVGGDLLSGDIHDELTESNDKPIVPTFHILFCDLIWAIKTLADHFGRVFIPWTSGNHSRLTKKVQAKNFSAKNLDYLMGLQLEKFFEDDKRVTFYIPASTESLYNIYGYRYLLTHGNAFRGGDGLIGPLGPITRGDHKKRSRNQQIDMDYDTMIIGHFHQLMMLRRFIVNGSVVGYNEYAFDNSFPFEVPQQALWITNPDRGITFSMPVQLTPKQKGKSDLWTSWPKG